MIHRALIQTVFSPALISMILVIFLVDVWQSGVKAGLQNIVANVFDLIDWIKYGPSEEDAARARANRAALRRALRLRSDR